MKGEPDDPDMWEHTCLGCAYGLLLAASGPEPERCKECNSGGHNLGGLWCPVGVMAVLDERLEKPEPREAYCRECGGMMYWLNSGWQHLFWDKFDTPCVGRQPIDQGVMWVADEKSESEE